MRLNAHIKNFAIIIFASIVPTLLVWAPFYFQIESIWGIKLPQKGMETVVANFDGPYYIVAAKTLYNPEELGKFQFSLPNEYYSAHFPGFPLLIRAFSPILGYPWAMMAVTVASTIFALWFFYLLLKQSKLENHALWLTLIFAIFPARWLIVHSIGSPEPLFIGSIIAAYYFFLKKNYWLTGVFGAVVMLTKSPGILLFAALFFGLVWPRLQELLINPLRAIPSLAPKILPLFLIPLTAFGIFLFYGNQYGDFFAYFHSGDNIHLLFPPFQVFNAAERWVGTFWLEEIVWIYLFGFLGIFQLIKQKNYEFAWFVGVFFVSTLFVSHRDVSRYILPIVPFLLISFSDVLISKPFRWALLFISLPIYLFALNFIIGNVTPVADWGPLL